MFLFKIVCREMMSLAQEMIEKLDFLQKKTNYKSRADNSGFGGEVLKEIRHDIEDIDENVFKLSVSVDTKLMKEASENLVKKLSVSKKSESDPIGDITKGLTKHKQTLCFISANLFSHFKK